MLQNGRQFPGERGEMSARTAAQGRPREHDHLIRQVAESDTFQSAPTMRALLLYLWDHQGEQVNEYAIATEALGRNADFDPKVDSTVRVHIARLRRKVDDEFEPKLVRTVRGVGFMLSEEER